MQAATIKNSRDFEDFEPINVAKFNNNLDVFREMEPEARAAFVNGVKDKYAKMLADEQASVQGELDRLSDIIDIKL